MDSNSRYSAADVSDLTESQKNSRLITKEDDQIDSSPIVYKSTTELLQSSDSLAKNTLSDKICCYRVRNGWRKLKSKIPNFSNRQWTTLVVLCLGTLTSSLSVCLFPPYFPKLAESKGETATVYGIVIGTNCLTAFIVTPIIGKNLQTIGVNFAFISGTIVSGACCCLSGFLEYFRPGYSFVLLAIMIRVVHATANAGIITSTMAFIAYEFPKSVAFLFSLTRATMNFAQMFGPILGGALQSFGGFKVPFFVLGAIQIVVSIICGFYLPEFRGKPRSKNRVNWSIMKIPGLWISFLTFILSTMSNGFLSITLEPYVLRKFNISPLYVGVLFGLKDGANCLASPIWGLLCDRFTKVKIFITIGSMFGALSFLLLGPFPGFPIEQTLTIVTVSLFINGIGVGGQQVAGVVSAMRDAVIAGYPDEAETHAFITGLWSSLSGAGRFISRTGSGILVDTIGFKYTSVIATALNVVVFLMTSIYILVVSNMKPNDFKSDKDAESNNDDDEKKPLLDSPTIPVPVIREDLEGSFMIGSASSRASRRLSKVFNDRRKEGTVDELS